MFHLIHEYIFTLTNKIYKTKNWRPHFFFNSKTQLKLEKKVVIKRDVQSYLINSPRKVLYVSGPLIKLEFGEDKKQSPKNTL